MPKTIRLVITGLQQSGKSVFITSLINNLVYAHEQMNQSCEMKEHELTLIGSLQKTSGPSNMKTFPFRRYLENLRKDPPAWPGKTFDLSGCTINLEFGVDSQFGRLNLEIVDYPGERILDLGMMQQSFRTWSEQQVEKSLSEEKFQPETDWVSRRDMSDQWRIMLDRFATMDSLTDAAAFDLVNAYKNYQSKCLEAGMEFVQPSVVALEHFAENTHSDYRPYPLDFCPLPTPFTANRNTQNLYRKFGRNYDRYRQKFVKSFYQELTKADVQIVLIDVLRVLQRGVQSFNDVQELIDTILENYTYARDVSRVSWRNPREKLELYADALFSRRIRKTIFAATKADLVVKTDRPKLAALVQQIVYKWLKRFEITASDEYTRVTFCAANSATEAGFSSRSQQPVLQALVLEENPADPERREARDCVYVPPDLPQKWPDEAWDIRHFVYPWKVLPKKLPARDGAAINNIGLDSILVDVLRDFLPRRNTPGDGADGGI